MICNHPTWAKATAWSLFWNDILTPKSFFSSVLHVCVCALVTCSAEKAIFQETRITGQHVEFPRWGSLFILQHPYRNCAKCYWTYNVTKNVILLTLCHTKRHIMMCNWPDSISVHVWIQIRSISAYKTYQVVIPPLVSLLSPSEHFFFCDAETLKPQDENPHDAAMICPLFPNRPCNSFKSPSLSSNVLFHMLLKYCKMYKLFHEL